MIVCFIFDKLFFRQTNLNISMFRFIIFDSGISEKIFRAKK